MGMLENSGCLPSLMNDLASLLHEINPYVAAYRMMRDFESEKTQSAAIAGRVPQDVHMWIHQDTANEVAIVFKTRDGEPPFEQDICVHPKDGHMHNISILSQHADPMTYPLLFPYGDRGWVKDTPLQGHGKRKHITHLQYYSYRLATRDDFHPILSAGKLFQQYSVDAYVKIEGNRLQYYQIHPQIQLRSDLYSGLMDHLNYLTANEGVKPGTICILPSTFQGSPRAQQQNFQDAMAIVRKFGKPDIFLTFTCNSQWTEIQRNLKNGEQAHDRLDLVARVFQLKLKGLMRDLLVNKVLGCAVAHVYVIEFQKRGLPHCDLVLILANDDKPKTADVIDNIVCAEIPDPHSNPRLYQIVKNNMVHGPCGIDFNMESPCMNENHECTKGYPKDFSVAIRDNVSGYPIYRRRQDGTNMNVGNYQIDNRWIVPCNKYLLLKYNAHINVEISSTIKSVKYLFKYVYKGHDRATLTFKNTTNDYCWDKPSMFIDSSTFKEAAQKRNLPRDDTEWQRCLQEATLLQMPHQLRQLFAIICALCNPTDPPKLWDLHKEAMIEDFMRSYDREDSENRAINQIEQVLRLHNKSCVDMGLPQPSVVEQQVLFNLEEEMPIGNDLYNQLNEQQRDAFHHIKFAVDNVEATQQCFFLDGPGGSGKSFTYNALIHTFHAEGVKYKSVALTGIAAELLPDGRTVHSTFGAPLKLTEDSTSSVTATSYKGKELIDTQVIIWDECTMASTHLLHLVDRLFMRPHEQRRLSL
ncbi:LOW QUALITY PROTEIN: uncharacterized protein LOC120523984 [Polypterus senegalus]|uniref:LOW QUALITY PROTEIN: uncharacterized protein LOC120523984 n=1 Tax=Polypterus senegalus TaxID=55291 RepID=UPI001963F965|nr:LOW QUALITY PROTEIN: uncharacterized protein LOC120523984 [Polypterus senegalus]